MIYFYDIKNPNRYTSVYLNYDIGYDIDLSIGLIIGISTGVFIILYNVVSASIRHCFQK